MRTIARSYEAIVARVSAERVRGQRAVAGRGTPAARLRTERLAHRSAERTTAAELAEARISESDAGETSGRRLVALKAGPRPAARPAAAPAAVAKRTTPRDAPAVPATRAPSPAPSPAPVAPRPLRSLWTDGAGHRRRRGADPRRRRSPPRRSRSPRITACGTGRRCRSRGVAARRSHTRCRAGAAANADGLGSVRIRGARAQHHAHRAPQGRPNHDRARP